MANVTVALLIPATQRLAAIAAIALLTPEYTVGFIRACCPLDPEPTWETPPTHYYSNGGGVEPATLAAWSEAAATTEPTDPLHGLVLFTAQNAANAFAWALTNLSSQGLRFVPDEE